MTTKTNILIVDDDKGLVELIKIVLAKENYNLTTKCTGSDALLYLRDTTPDLMLLDFSLPDYKANEFVEILRKEKVKIPPFIMSTCQGDERIAVTMMKHGARDYLMKDFKYLENLPATIQRVLQELDCTMVTTGEIYPQFDPGKNILRNLNSIVFSLSSEGFFTWVNNAITILGYSEDQILGKHLLSIVNQSDWSTVSNSLIDIVSNQKDHVIRFTANTTGGKSIDLVAYLNPGTDLNGKIIVGIAHVDSNLPAEKR